MHQKLLLGITKVNGKDTKKNGLIETDWKRDTLIDNMLFLNRRAKQSYKLLYITYVIAAAQEIEIC